MTCPTCNKQVIAGVLYLSMSVIAFAGFRIVPIGFIISGVVSLVHGGLLVAKVDIVQKYTKIACGGRLAMVVYTLSLLAPYIAVLKSVGSLFLVVMVIDLISLILMIQSADDVYFSA